MSELGNEQTTCYWSAAKALQCGKVQLVRRTLGVSAFFSYAYFLRRWWISDSRGSSVLLPRIAKYAS